MYKYLNQKKNPRLLELNQKISSFFRKVNKESTEVQRDAEFENL